MRKRTRPASRSLISSEAWLNETRAPLTTARSDAHDASSATNPWSRTGTTFSAITSGMTATGPSVTGLYVGASGFAYPSWRGGFYPSGARPAEFLELYSARLPSVEINNTGYRLPRDGELGALAARAPDGFRFAVKMSRRITYGGQFGLARPFCTRAREMGDRLGPVLVQLEEGKERDDELLQRLLGTL